MTTSRMDHALRESAFLGVLRTVHDRLNRHPAVNPQATAECLHELERVVAGVDTSVLLSSVEHAFGLPSRVYRHSVVATEGLAIIERIDGLEAWQRIRLLGWMLFAATMTAAVVAGFGDSGSRLLLIGIWAASIALACCLMWGCRPIASAWRDYARSERG